MEEDRMRVPCVRAPQDDDIGLLGLAVGTRAPSRTKNRRQTGDARRVSRAVAAIDVIAAHDHPSELLCHEVHLVGSLRAAEQAEGGAAVRIFSGGKPLRRPCQRLVPCCPPEGSVLAYQGICKPCVFFSTINP